MAQWFWSVLDIASTGQVAEIRRAYADRLRAMDIDADPDGYQRLRSARDAALASARAKDRATADPAIADDEWSTARADAGSAGHDARFAGTEPASRPGQGQDVEAAEAPEAEADGNDDGGAEDRRRQRLEQALTALAFRGNDEGRLFLPSEEEEREMVALFEAVVASPSLQGADALNQASYDFADFIAHAMPRSDCLIGPASRFFGWRKQDELHGPPALEAVVARSRALDFRDAVDTPGHRYHKAWVWLATGQKLGLPWITAGQRERQRELLAQIRSTYPTLEHDLDWENVAKADDQPQLTIPIMALGIAGVVYLVLMVSGHFTQTDNADRPDIRTVADVPLGFDPSTELSDRRRDISEVLERMTHGTLDGATLAQRNVVLYENLDDRWQAAKDAGTTRDAFRLDTGTFIVNHVLADLPRAPVATLRDILELRLQEAHRKRLPDDCVDMIGGGLFDLPHADDKDPIGQLIIAIDPTRSPAPPPSTFSFDIPPTVLEKAARNVSMDRAMLIDALNGKGHPAYVCNAKKAIVAATLAAPEPVSGPLIRKMFGG